MDAWGPRRKIAVGCFVVGRAKARVAFMPPSGIRCDCVAEREVRHRLAVNSEVKECDGTHSVEKCLDLALRKGKVVGETKPTETRAPEMSPH